MELELTLINSIYNQCVTPIDNPENQSKSYIAKMWMKKIFANAFINRVIF